MMKKNLGFPIDKIFVLRLRDGNLIKNGEVFKRALLKNHNIVAVSFSSGTPGSNVSRTSNFNPKGGNKDDERQMQFLDVDYDFLKTYGLKIKSGRFFSPEFSSDSTNAYILNETAMRKFGWQNIDGEIITKGGNDENVHWENVIGVLQDFNYSSLKQNIPPMVLSVKKGGNNFLSLQLTTSDVKSTREFIKKTYSKFSSGYPFDYFFL